MSWRSILIVAACAASTWIAAACGSSDLPPAVGGGPDASVDAIETPDAAAPLDAAPDTDFGAASDAYPAFKPPVPQVTKGRAAVMASVRVVPVFFSGDPLQAQLVDFLQKYAAAPHWRTAVSEYGVGPLTVATPVVLTSPPSTIDPNAIEAMLRRALDGTFPEWGPIDGATLATTVYALYFPSATTVTGTCAPTQVYAYHGNVSRGALGPDAGVDGGPNDAIIYAVLPRCAPMNGYTALDLLTSLTTHELVESATDPSPETQVAYYDVDADHRAWQYVSGGGEVGDLCQNFFPSGTRPADVGYLIQRTWSNASIKAFHDPCVPIPTTYSSFFASVPVEPDTVTLVNGVQHYQTKGVIVPVGTSKTIDVLLFSDGPTSGAWAVRAYDYAKDWLGGTSSVLSLSLDRTKGVNGEKMHLTIKPLVRPTDNTAFYLLQSTLDGVTHTWWGAVEIR